MDIGKRLRELRAARGLSQSAIRKRASLSDAYVSRVERGRATPSLGIMERWAKALDVELYQLFFVGHGEAKAPVLTEKIRIGSQEQTLLGLCGQMSVEDRAFVISLARNLVRRKGNRG